MLTLERRIGESIFLTLSNDVDPNTPIGELFSKPIEIKFYEKRGNKIALAIEAPKPFIYHAANGRTDDDMDN